MKTLESTFPGGLLNREEISFLLRPADKSGLQTLARSRNEAGELFAGRLAAACSQRLAPLFFHPLSVAAEIGNFDEESSVGFVFSAGGRKIACRLTKADAALLAAHDRAQVGVKNVAAFHVRIHLLHTPRKKYVRISRRCFYSPTQRSKINKEPFAFFSVRMLPCHSMQEGAKNGGFSQTMYCRICEVSAPRWQMRGMRLLIWQRSS